MAIFRERSGKWNLNLSHIFMQSIKVFTHVGSSYNRHQKKFCIPLCRMAISQLKKGGKLVHCLVKYSRSVRPCYHFNFSHSLHASLKEISKIVY